MSVEEFDFPMPELAADESEAAKKRIDDLLTTLLTASDDLDLDIKNAQDQGVELPNPHNDPCRYIRVAGRIIAQSGVYFHVLTYNEMKTYLHSLSPDELEFVKMARSGVFPLPFRE